MSLSKAFATSLTICSLCGLLIPIEPATANDVRSQLKELKEAYLANRSAFEHGKCRFRYTRTSADSEADALASKWNDKKPRLNREYTFFFDKDSFTIKTDLDREKLAKELQSDDGLLVPETVAAKGAYAIHHDGLVNNAIVYSPKNDKLHVRYHPFNLARDADVSLASSVDYASARNFEGANFRIDQVKLDDRSYIRVTQAADYDSINVVRWIDPSRGYLSFRTDYIRPRTGELSSQMYLLDVHEENNAYFPTHAMLIDPVPSADDTAYVEVHEMKVEELDLSYKPTPEDLSISLPNSTQYYDGVNPKTAKTLYRNSKERFVPISVDRIEDIYNTLQEIARQRAKDAAANTK